jgi:hypothetical protein
MIRAYTKRLALMYDIPRKILFPYVRGTSIVVPISNQIISGHDGPVFVGLVPN